MAITYTSSKRVSLKLNRASYVATALTKLASNAVGPALTLETDSQDPNATPLKLDTETPSQAPMSVDSSTKVTNLNADMVDGKEADQLAGSIASVATISDFPGFDFPLGTGEWKFVGAPATGITTTSSQRLVGAAGVPLSDPTATGFGYDLCYRPSGGTTLTPFSGPNTSSAILTSTKAVYTATSSVVPGAGTWDVGFCLSSNATDPRDAQTTGYVNGWVMVVNQ